MTVRVCQAQAQCSNTLAGRNLESMVDRGCLVLQASDAGNALELAVRVGIITASSLQVNGRLSGDCSPVDDRAHIRKTRVNDRAALSVSDRLARQERIFRGWRGHELVEVTLSPKMCSLAANVRKSGHDMRWQFLLHIQVPLLHVRPDHLGRN